MHTAQHSTACLLVAQWTIHFFAFCTLIDALFYVGTYMVQDFSLVLTSLSRWQMHNLEINVLNFSPGSLKILQSYISYIWRSVSQFCKSHGLTENPVTILTLSLLFLQSLPPTIYQSHSYIFADHPSHTHRFVILVPYLIVPTRATSEQKSRTAGALCLCSIQAFRGAGYNVPTKPVEGTLCVIQVQPPLFLFWRGCHLSPTELQSCPTFCQSLLLQTCTVTTLPLFLFRFPVHCAVCIVHSTILRYQPLLSYMCLLQGAPCPHLGLIHCNGLCLSCSALHSAVPQCRQMSTPQEQFPRVAPLAPLPWPCLSASLPPIVVPVAPSQVPTPLRQDQFPRLAPVTL